MNIKKIVFPATQYIAEALPKKQIYIHHTAGGADGVATFKDWASNPERIATAFAISRSGEVVQGFSADHWAYHLGLKESTFHRMGKPYRSLDKISIGIELCSWGQLTEKSGIFYNYVGKKMDAQEVCTLETPFKGYTFYHAYTSQQIASLAELLRELCTHYQIPKEYKADIWDLCPRAFSQVSGIYTHNSVRSDKVDAYPHPKLVEALQNL